MPKPLSPFAELVKDTINAELARRGAKIADVLEATGMSPDTFRRRRLGQQPWQLDEIEEVAHYLEVSPWSLTGA